MKIGLLPIDGYVFPNIPLMKLSAYHKAQGDSVEFINPMYGKYDRVYMSKIFTFSPDFQYHLRADEIIKGGTGYGDFKTVLPKEIEHICPDYSLYATDTAYGHLTRGCTNKCSWCVVPQKEGNIRANADIEEFLDGKKKAILLDNNILASDWGLKQIEKIIQLGIRVDFNQGLDARIASENTDIMDILVRVKQIRYIRFACDTKAQIPAIIKCIEYLTTKGIKPYNIFVYVLIKDFTDARERLRVLRKYGVTPFAQPYRDFRTGKTLVTEEQARLARWCNRKEIFKSVDFEEYQKNYKREKNTTHQLIFK